MPNVEFQDKPETKPFDIVLTFGEEKERIALDIGNCAIALFRHRPEMDYLAVYVEEDEEDKNRWVYCFDRHYMIYWMGGIALTGDGQRALRLADRENGTFHSRYGFRPDVVVEDWPAEHEIESYISYQIGDSFEDPHQDLSEALREEFPDGEV